MAFCFLGTWFVFSPISGTGTDFRRQPQSCLWENGNRSFSMQAGDFLGPNPLLPPTPQEQRRKGRPGVTGNTFCALWKPPPLAWPNSLLCPKALLREPCQCLLFTTALLCSKGSLLSTARTFSLGLHPK